MFGNNFEHLKNAAISGKIEKLNFLRNIDSVSYRQVIDWSKEDVETFAKWTGVTITYKGSEKGQVTDQSIKANQDLKKNQKLTVTLK